MTIGLIRALVASRRKLGVVDPLVLEEVNQDLVQQTRQEKGQGQRQGVADGGRWDGVSREGMDE